MIGGGHFNVAEAPLSTIPGGAGAVASKYGQLAYASGSFAGNFATGGDAQMSMYVLRNSTTNSTQTEVFLDGGSSRMGLSSGSSWTFDILIVGRNSTGDSAHYQIVGGIKNDSGTTVFVGTPVKTVLGEDVAGWDVTVSADDTNDALVIKVTGDSSTIRWVATVRTVEVKN
jgi:hypothetical protein